MNPSHHSWTRTSWNRRTGRGDWSPKASGLISLDDEVGDQIPGTAAQTEVLPFSGWGRGSCTARRELQSLGRIPAHTEGEEGNKNIKIKLTKLTEQRITVRNRTRQTRAKLSGCQITSLATSKKTTWCNAVTSRTALTKCVPNAQL